MAERKKINIPKRLKDKYGDKFIIWSYSRLGTYHNCLWEYYLARIKKEKGEDNIYSVCGTYAHDILESLYNNQIEYKNMATKFEENFLDVEISDYKFTSDEEKNLSMVNKYKSCVIHFFKYHKMVNSKVLTEKEIWVDINGNVFIGYVDAMHKENNKYIITDYKTSSILEFKGDKLLEKQKQLLLYALGLNQIGIPLEEIEIRWNFLKYTNIIVNHMINVTYFEKDKFKTSCLSKDQWVSKVKTQLKKDIQEYYPDKNNKQLREMVNDCIASNSLISLPLEIQNKYILSDVIKTGERNNWVKAISSQLKKDLKQIGLEDVEIETLLIDCINANTLEPLNNIDISNNYLLDDCYVYGIVNKESVDGLIEDMTLDINNIKAKGNIEDNWSIEGVTKDKEYYCNVLCGYKKYCKYYKKYIDDLKANNMNLSKDDFDLLAELESI